MQHHNHVQHLRLLEYWGTCDTRQLLNDKGMAAYYNGKVAGKLLASWLNEDNCIGVECLWTWHGIEALLSTTAALTALSSTCASNRNCICLSQRMWLTVVRLLRCVIKSATNNKRDSGLRWCFWCELVHTLVRLQRSGAMPATESRTLIAYMSPAAGGTALYCKTCYISTCRKCVVTKLRAHRVATDPVFRVTMGLRARVMMP